MSVDAEAWGRGVRRRVDVRDVPAEVLALVDSRIGVRCCEDCWREKRATPPGEKLQLDHRRPISRGGDNHHSNLRWLCEGHNKARGDRPGSVEPVWARGPGR